jgi:hypothetical protein
VRALANQFQVYHYTVYCENINPCILLNNLIVSVNVSNQNSRLIKLRVKLSLCLLKHHKAVSPEVFLASAPVDVSGWLHDPVALLPGHIPSGH